MVTKKCHFPKTESCNENAFFTFRTQIVFAYFPKNAIFAQETFFVHNHLVGLGEKTKNCRNTNKHVKHVMFGNL